MGARREATDSLNPRVFSPVPVHPQAALDGSQFCEAVSPTSRMAVSKSVPSSGLFSVWGHFFDKPRGPQMSPPRGPRASPQDESPLPWALCVCFLTFLEAAFAARYIGTCTLVLPSIPHGALVKPFLSLCLLLRKGEMRILLASHTCCKDGKSP